MTEEERLLIEAARRGLLPADKPAASKADDVRAHFAKVTDRGENAGVKGFVRGLRDIPDAGAQLLTRGLEAVAPAGSGFEEWARGQRQTVEAINQGAEQDYRANWLGGQPPSTAASVGRFAGNVAATAPVAAVLPGAAAATLPGRMVGGAAAGAAVAPMMAPDLKANTPDEFWAEKARQAAGGALGGAIAPAVVEPLQRFLSPARPDVQTLMQAGVRPTPGQISGGIGNRIEEGLQSVPIVGDAIRSARRAAVADLNKAAINKTLAPIGEKLSGSTPVGREAIGEMQAKISAAYDEVIPRIAIPGVDLRFVQDVSNIAKKSVIPTVREDFNKIVQQSIMPRLTNGPLEGRAFQEVDQKLGALASGYRISPDVDKRELGKLLLDLKGSFADLAARFSPAAAADLKAANKAFAMSVRVNDAAARTGSEGGVFSPAALMGGVTRADRSARKSAVARGDALLQDLADPAKRVLGDKVPDSGTAGRAMLGLGTLGALGGGATFAPMTAAGTAAGLGLLSIPYLPGARRLTAQALASRGPTAETLRGLLELGAVPAGALLGSR